MKIYRLKLNESLNLNEKYVLTLGFFDGLHLGHQSLIHEVLRVSKEKKLVPALMTFSSHPLSVLKNQKTTRLMSLEDKIEQAGLLGIEVIFIIEFTQEVAALSPEMFMEKYLLDLHVKHLVVGRDFRFGHRNLGTIETLENQSFDLSVMDPVMYDRHQKVSSTLIKTFLSSGNIVEANRLLTRPFRVKGKVIHGKQRGRLMGFPTANIDYGVYHMPLRGVYGVKFYVKNQMLIGMANIGKNPTFNDIDKDSLEIHLFDFDEDIYDLEAIVEFYVFERPETKFNGMDQLIDRLTKDRLIVAQMMNNIL